LIDQISTKSAANNNDCEILHFDLAGLFFNSLSANVAYTSHESDVTCSRCGASYW